MKWKSSFIPPLRPAVGSKASFLPQASFGAITANPSSSVPIMPSSLPRLQSMPIARPCTLPPLQSHRLVVATATTAISQPSPFVGFMHLFISFIAGGIFFSSLLAGATTFFAVGQSNVSRVWSLAKTVICQVWTVFVAGVNEARMALRFDGKWQPGKAWQVLKSKLGETRKAAAEGMSAMKAEKDFYAGVVGQPGLITAQYFLDRLMPFSLTTQLENALRDSLKAVKNDLIKTISLKEFNLGNVNPTLLEARNYDLGDDAMAFDVDVKWESAVYAKMSVTTKRMGIKVPVTVRNATFIGTARVEMTPLTKEPPGWGAILISLANVPKIGLRLDTVGADLTKIPWLKKEITKALQKAIEDQLLWPKRLVLPSLTVPPNSKTVISKGELNQLSTNDPLLKAESALEQQAVLKDHINSMKPNVTALPGNLQVSVDGDDDDEDETSNATATSGKNVEHGSNPFANFMRNRKHAHQTKSSTHHADELSALSTPVGLDKNATIVPDSNVKAVY